MDDIRHGLTWATVCLAGLFCVFGAGCCGCPPAPCAPPDTPRELAKAALPPYVIEPPDILLIDAVRVVPLPPYKIEPLDALLIQATNTLPNEPINGVYSIEPDGRVNLGLSYGSVQVSGQTLEAARDAIEKQLAVTLKMPRVFVALAQSRAQQQIRGEHLVRPDGTVGLGIYGSVSVAGMTLDQARAEIEAHLSRFLQNPEVSVDVFAYNSKVYYIIFDGAGYGEQVYRLPITGNETVLDAVAQLNGIPAQASKYHITLVRPRLDEHGEDCDQVLPVCWEKVARCGRAGTNYQIYPGDRVFVQADTLICTDNWLAKAISPVERLFGITLLGNTTVRSFRTNNGNGNNNNNNFSPF